MRILLQRVSHASVRVDDHVCGQIGPGLLAFVGFGKTDTKAQLRPALEKILNLRIFSDAQGRFAHSLADGNADLLLVPQFTLFADTTQGRRPYFGTALEPDSAKPLFESLVEEARTLFPGTVASGIFGADMKVSLENDGPVTIWIDDL